MVKHASLFSQLIAQFNRPEFSRLVREHNAERYSKGFSSWDHFVAMLFCQLAQAKSLREICGGLSCCLGKLVHLGMKDAPSKSTLSYANAHRSWEMYRDMFYQTLNSCKAGFKGKHKFKFKNKLLSMDSTTISLCLSLFPWAKFRSTKGAVKLHLLLDHDGYFPSFAHITNGDRHEVTMASRFPLEPGSIVVLDRGYNNYSLFSSWTEKGIYFVTRLKDNAAYKVEADLLVPENRNILSDQLITFTGHYASKDCPHLLRRIVAWDKENDCEITFLTNHLDFGATTIANIYKDRWQIEVFFKALKQNLKIKTFVGTSENALFIQIWTALTVMLLIKYLQFKSKTGWSLSNLIAFLRWNLFTYRDLWQWINDPYNVLPLGVDPVQKQLTMFGIGQQ